MDFSPEAPYLPNEEERNLLKVDMDSLTPEQLAKMAKLQSQTPSLSSVEAARLVLAQEEAEKAQNQE